MTTVHILYENPDWLPPLEAALVQEGFEVKRVHVAEGLLDTSPEAGIYLNRMSPSSHTRGNLQSVALMREYLAFLHAHEMRVVNGLNAFELEMSKLRQYFALTRYGIQTPRTALAVGKDNLLRLAQSFEGPFITKHNQGGKGLGIALFNSAEELRDRLEEQDFDYGPNQQMIIQTYIQSAEPFITRVEIVGQRLIFAMHSATDDGFELCPSDVCQLESARKKNPDNCPIDGGAKFRQAHLAPDDPLVLQYRALCAGEEIEVAGIEFVTDKTGQRFTYDINGTTNYNAALGKTMGMDGMQELARYLRHVVTPQLR